MIGWTPLPDQPRPTGGMVEPVTFAVIARYITRNGQGDLVPGEWFTATTTTTEAEARTAVRYWETFDQPAEWTIYAILGGDFSRGAQLLMWSRTGSKLQASPQVQVSGVGWPKC